MALPAGNAGAAQGHTLVKQAVVPNFHRRSDHNAGAVINDQPPADGRRRVNLHPGGPFGMLGHPAGQEMTVVPVEPVGNAIVYGCMQPIVQEKNFQCRPGRRIIFLISANGFA